MMKHTESKGYDFKWAFLVLLALAFQKGWGEEHPNLPDATDPQSDMSISTTKHYVETNNPLVAQCLALFERKQYQKFLQCAIPWANQIAMIRRHASGMSRLTFC